MIFGFGNIRISIIINVRRFIESQLVRLAILGEDAFAAGIDCVGANSRQQYLSQCFVALLIILVFYQRPYDDTCSRGADITTLNSQGPERKSLKFTELRVREALKSSRSIDDL
jgi:hypothetical protein